MDLNKYIEHTLLRPDATRADLINIFEDAKKYNFYGVCINPVNVKLAYEYLKDTAIKIVTVIGFPLGANYSETKAFETKKAVLDGADEIDMVLNIGCLKNKDYNFVKQDILNVRIACPEKILKVIIETDLLSEEEIKQACEICIQAKADFVKTSTGFVKNGVGAKIEDIKVMHDIVSPYGLQVKASGGIKDKEKAQKLIEAGATRLGTSSSIKIISE